MNCVRSGQGFYGLILRSGRRPTLTFDDHIEKMFATGTV